MIYPSREEFKKLSSGGGIIPVYKEIPADLETPVSAFIKLRGRGCSFLLESVERGEQLGRYSFLGIDTPLLLKFNEGKAYFNKDGKLVTEDADGKDPLNYLRELLLGYKRVHIAGLPRFWGGAVGYLSYEVVRFFEKLPSIKPDEMKLPDAIFLLTDNLIIFDHVMQKMQIVSTAFPDGDPDKRYDDSIKKIETIISSLKKPLEIPAAHSASSESFSTSSNFTKEKFESAVEKAKEYIEAGDAFQIVVSQRLKRKTSADPLAIYRALRMLNPSPYMFFLDFNDFQMIGSSPEVLVKLEDGIAEERPIAGTRHRGATEEEDERLKDELLADPKEKAEHVMLVDLGRNDLGRVCRYGTVKVSKLMDVERYSHVMHMVSTVKGVIEDTMDQFDLERACFPAGTVTGAPKIRAMEIIEELEPSRRGPYAGCVGYFSFWGNMDTCITIRTIIMKGDNAYLQAGAGIVADSVPEKEYEETLNKIQALVRAIEMAEEGLE